jgi:peroxiredoxin
MEDALNVPAWPAYLPHATRIKMVPLMIVIAVAIFVCFQRVSESLMQPGSDRPEQIARGSERAFQETPKPVATDLQDILAHPDLIPSHEHPLLGRQAPDFKLVDLDGKVCDLGELREGQPTVLIFYYGFHCKNCVRHLFDINRDVQLFQEVGARVVAISAVPPELTRQQLPSIGSLGFPVLSDPGNTVARAYQVFRGDLLRHGTFLIDREGIVRWVNVGDAPFRRNSALLTHLAKMGDRLPSVEAGSSGGSRP